MNMKTLSILAYVMPLTCVTAQSLPCEQADFIVTNTNDTLPMSITFPSTADLPFADYISIQEKRIATSTTPTAEYTPLDIKAFQYHSRNYESVWWKQNNGDISRRFCQRILSGKVDVLLCSVNQEDESGEQAVVPILCLRKGDELKTASLLHLSQLTGRLMTRSTTAAQTIEAGDSNPASIIEVVRQYNEYQRPKTSN